MDPTIFLVVGAQVLAVGIALAAFGPAVIRRVPGANNWVIFGRTLAIVAGIVLLAVPFVGGATPMSGATNPNAATVTSIQNGAELYQATCARCHGVDGKGGGVDAGTTPVTPPSLVDHAAAHPDGDLFYWIQNGLPGGMPAWGSQLTDSQIWDIVNYLRSIEKR